MRWSNNELFTLIILIFVSTLIYSAKSGISLWFANVVSLELCLAQISNRGLYGSELATVHDVGIKKAKLENNSTSCFIPGSTIADNVHS